MRDTILQLVRDSTKRLSQHALVVRAAEGRLTKSEVVSWIFCAGAESRTFPTIVQSALASATDGLRDVLARNLRDELGEGDPVGSHFEHYLHLLDEIGVPRERFTAFQPAAELQEALTIAERMCAGPPARLYGYLLVNEAATSPIYGAIEASTIARFPGQRSEFFRLHVEGDAVHVEDLAAVMDSFSCDEQPLVEDGVRTGERGLCLVLDEAQRRAEELRYD